MRTLAPLVVAGALALAGCGSSDEDKIRDVIQDVAQDAAAICDHGSDRFLEQFESQGGCDEFARAYPDESAQKIDGEIAVEIDGDAATADFTDNKNRDQHVLFVKQDGDWKVDAIE